MSEHRKRLSMRALLALACAASAAPATAAAEGQWAFSTGLDYTTGSYGGISDTDIIIAPFTAAYSAERWSASITVPYVSVEGAPGVVPGAAGAGGLGSLSGLTNPLFGAGGGVPAVAPDISEQGLGDVTLELGYTPFVSESGTRLALAAGARLPTGDESRSLGAGDTVLSVAAIASQRIAPRAAVYGSIGYASVLDEGDGALFAAGGLEGYVSRRVMLGVSAEWSEARVAAQPERTQATLYAGFDLNDDVRLTAYAIAGLSDSAPDSGAGLRLVFH